MYQLLGYTLMAKVPQSPKVKHMLLGDEFVNTEQREGIFWG